MKRRAVTGFTLLELLVAMAIFALISAMALGGLNTLLTQQVLAREDMGRLRDLQRTMQLLGNDFAQLHPRVVRDTLGRSTEPYLATYGAGEYAVRLTRGGWRNPAGLPRGTLQRVQYRVEDNELVREYWPVVDAPLGMEPRAQVLITEVEAFEIEYLDNDLTWHGEWPPLEQAGNPAPVRPKAVRLRLELGDWGEIERLVEITQ